MGCSSSSAASPPSAKPQGVPVYQQPYQQMPDGGQGGPYGQPPMGQPVYGQPAYGQPPMGQPIYGQPAYGQPPMGQPVAGRKAPPVDVDIAKGFLAALISEYVQKVDCGVGNYFDSKGVPQHIQDQLDPFEREVSTANNPNAQISDIAARWGFTRVGGGFEVIEECQQSFEGFIKAVPTEQYLDQMRRALGAPATQSSQALVQAGWQSNDMEVLRMAIAVAPSQGLAPQVGPAAERLREMKQLPSDWDMVAFSAGTYLEGQSGGRQSSSVVAFQPQPPVVLQQIQSLFDATYRKVYTRDRRGAPIPDKFQVKEVLRVMNEQVWREYDTRRSDVRRCLQGASPTVPNGAQTTNHLKTLGTSALPALDASVNEHWLFHGTTRDAAQGIAENDFRLDLTGSNAGTLYGKGIYLAENASKSDEYGEGPKGPAGDEAERGYEAPRPPPGPPPPLVRQSFILLCRSTLGRVLYTDEQRPDPNNLVNKCTKAKEFESVLGDRLKRNGTFREVVVYDDDKVYPEFIVRYERQFFHERFAEVYKQMSLRKQQGAFNGPTSAEKEVLLSMWNVYAMPNHGKINKWQLLDLLNAIQQPPENENDDLDATFKEWDTKKDGWIDSDEFLQEMTQRVKDGICYYGA